MYMYVLYDSVRKRKKMVKAKARKMERCTREGALLWSQVIFTLYMLIFFFVSLLLFHLFLLLYSLAIVIATTAPSKRAFYRVTGRWQHHPSNSTRTVCTNASNSPCVCVGGIVGWLLMVVTVLKPRILRFYIYMLYLPLLVIPPSVFEEKSLCTCSHEEKQRKNEKTKKKKK